MLLIGSLAHAEDAVQEDTDIRQVLSPLGTDTVGKALPELVIDNPYRYVFGKPGRYLYKAVLKDDGSSHKRFELHTEDSGNNTELKKWTLNIDDSFIEEWMSDSRGDVHLVAQTDVDSGYRVVITPHLVLPSGARQGQHWKSESSLKVYETSDPETVAYEGTLLSDKVYEGRFEVVTPEGRFEAILISDDYKIEIGEVNIKDKRYTFYAPDIGKVAEIDGFHVSAFLFFHQRKNEAKVLMRLPQKKKE